MQQIIFVRSETEGWRVPGSPEGQKDCLTLNMIVPNTCDLTRPATQRHMPRDILIRLSPWSATATFPSVAVWAICWWTGELLAPRTPLMSGDVTSNSYPCQDKRPSSDSRNADHSVRNLPSYLLTELPYKVTLKLSLHKPGRNVAEQRLTARVILNLDARWRSFVSFTPRPLYFCERVPHCWVGPRRVLSVLKRKKCNCNFLCCFVWV
jgi:hypothetical protein